MSNMELLLIGYFSAFVNVHSVLSKIKLLIPYNSTINKILSPFPPPPSPSSPIMIRDAAPGTYVQ